MAALTIAQLIKIPARVNFLHQNPFRITDQHIPLSLNHQEYVSAIYWRRSEYFYSDCRGYHRVCYGVRVCGLPEDTKGRRQKEALN
jgi:hypothetical protein